MLQPGAATGILRVLPESVSDVNFIPATRAGFSNHDPVGGARIQFGKSLRVETQPQVATVVGYSDAGWVDQGCLMLSVQDSPETIRVDRTPRG